MKEKDITQIFADGTLIDLALKQAVEKALWQHKKASNSIAVWRDGRVVWIPPEEIPVPENLPPT
ncbi:MAG: hypothetical protein GDA43_03815 [Hormoscilla sp. SP5CHS1]|nr:hypothetical protein [Hormoscilla sp. SP12CHS1]MBC6452424.1 hypothetical protein [Hormoscilla sp. SP5CHS1]MBC6475584.1 hypothetical protein [Hormoscilla sp. GM102CHS1]